MRKYCIFILAMCLVLTLSPAAFAADYEIIDNGQVLTDGQESELSERAEEISQEYGVAVVIVTEEYLHNDTFSMADDHFYGGGYGDDGILFLLVINSRDWEIATYGTVAEVLSDSDTEDLFYSSRDYLADDDYYNGFTAYLDALDASLNSAGKPYSEDTSKQWLISFVIGLVVALISLLVMRGKMNTVRSQRAASEYLESGSYNLTKQHDLYLYSNTTRTRRSQNSSSGGGGGRSRGGSRGKF